MISGEPRRIERMQQPSETMVRWHGLDASDLQRMQAIYSAALSALYAIPECRKEPYLPAPLHLSSVLRALQVDAGDVGTPGVLDAQYRLVCEIVHLRKEHPFPAVFTWCALFAAAGSTGGMIGLADSLTDETGAAYWLSQDFPALVQHLCCFSERSQNFAIANTLQDETGDAMAWLSTPLCHLYSPLRRQVVGMMCRICHSTDGQMVTPCQCTGSMRWVHVACLRHWLSASPSRAACCEVCKQPYSEGLVQDLVQQATPHSDGTPEQDTVALIWMYEACESVRMAGLEQARKRQRDALKIRLQMRKS